MGVCQPQFVLQRRVTALEKLRDLNIDWAVVSVGCKNPVECEARLRSIFVNEGVVQNEADVTKALVVPTIAPDKMGVAFDLLIAFRAGATVDQDALSKCAFRCSSLITLGEYRKASADDATENRN